jgi:hypothetical protein
LVLLQIWLFGFIIIEFVKHSDRCYYFIYIFDILFLTKNKAKLGKNLIIT